MAKNRKDGVPGASRGRGLVIIFGILDVFCAAFLVISLIASPGGPISASVPAETLPAFEENSDHYGAAADDSETYTSGNSVVYNSPTAPETAASATTAAVPETTATVPAAEDPQQLYAGFLFPDSATVLITEAEIAAQANSKDLCQRAINEIYARYGYQFTKQENLDYFNQYAWYVGMPKVTDQEIISQQLNGIEKTNVATITNYMTARNWG